jgi:UDP-GlcNAc:undecaprenyl-phosphate GlcNAc-1-phosphate transferase
MIIDYKIALSFFTSFGLALIFLPKLANVAGKIGLMDQPDGRKSHEDAKPLVGGIGMVMAFVVSSLLFIPLPGFRGFYAGVIILIIAGFFDDYKELAPGWKFIAQITTSLLLIYFSDTVLLTFGNLLSFGDVNFGIFAIPMTIFCIVGVTNAINMIDGLDGLAGGITLIGLISFAILSYLGGHAEMLILCVALGGAVLGFLRYNWAPAKLFMGDAGSLFLGFALAFASIHVTQGEGSVVRPVVPLLILAVPITDTLTLIAKRLIVGRNPFSADTFHLHHMLIRFGLNRKQAVIAILSLCAVMSLVGILGTVFRVPPHFMFIFFLAYFFIHFCSSFWTDRRHAIERFFVPERRKHQSPQSLKVNGVRSEE